jgi:hypothetical protein
MKKETLFKVAETIAIIALLSFVYLKDINSVEFHIDESHWIGTSYMFEAYFKGEFWSDAWRDAHRTVTNPPVPRYVIGISRFIGGYRTVNLNRPWEYDRGINFNERVGAMPSDNLLWWSRLPMAILAVLSIVIGFFFAKKIQGRIAAYLWIVFAAISPYFLLQTRRAMAESSLLFFTMLGILFCYLGIKKIEHDAGKIRSKALVYLMGSSICIALAGESKMNGLIILAGVIFCTISVIFKYKDSINDKIRRSFFISTLLIFLTGAVFLALYPYLWPSPIGRTHKMFVDRVTEMQGQTIKHAPDHIDTLPKRLTIIPREIFENYAIIHFNGSLIINIVLFLIGFTVTARKAASWLRQGSDNTASIVLLTTATLASIPAFFTLLNWDRYYLFPVFFSTIFIAIASAWIGRRIFEWVAPKFPRQFAT